MSDDELARLRDKVHGGHPLDDGDELGAVIAELGRASEVTRPAATTLDAAVHAAEREAGRELAPAEIEQLWAANSGLCAVKALHDRERARWRAANAILEESNALAEMRRAGVPRFTSTAAPEVVADPAASDPEATRDLEGQDLLEVAVGRQRPRSLLARLRGR